MYYLYNPITSGLPQLLINLIPDDSHFYNTHSAGTITTYYFRTDVLKYLSVYSQSPNRTSWNWKFTNL